VDIPPAILERIRRDPLAEAQVVLSVVVQLVRQGQPVGLVVREYYPLFGEIVASGKSPEQVLRFFTKACIRRLARQLREGSERRRG